MAGPCSIKILLLCAGIIGVADCQTSSDVVSTLSPARTTTNLNSSPVVSPTFTSSTPRTTATPAVASDTPAAPNTPSLTLSTLPSNTSIQTTIPTNASAANVNPANTSNETTPTTTPTTNQTDSQALGNQTQTSPPTTQSTTTVTPTTEAPTPPQCSYTVTPIKFGFQINFINSSLGTYTVNVKEEGQNQIGGKAIFQHSNPNITTHNITALKPCTDYEHNVTFDHAGTKILCDHSDYKTTVTTMEMTEDDIKRSSCIPGYLCYKSDWNISSVQITANNIEAVQCPSDNKKFCIKPGYDDICTNLTTTFTQEKCVKSSFNHIQHISAAEFLNSNEINLIPPTELPAKIEANLPPNCIYLTIDYTCSDSYNNPKKVSELEPFTDYTCTGQIKENDVIIKNTPAIRFKIDCDLNIATQRDSTNTSIELSWTTTSQKCQEVLPELDGLSYDCSCHPVNSVWDKKHAKLNKQKPGRACHFSGLKPYTDYICKVQPIYNNKNVAKPTEVKEKTEPGVPDDISTLVPSVPEHNAIKVTCPHVKFFRGPEKLYNATLSYNGVIRKTKPPKTNCDFTFKDLSYLTTYKVEVVAFNGYLYSKTKTAHVDTLYNDKVLIGFLVLIFILIILTSVALLWVVYKIHMMKPRNSQDVNEDVMLESTAIYANVPQWHQKERR
ncbi:receptor-type tyrosine-protein phosphatase C-like [Thunnus albacares]|uniref:receptor-type tyrosine-protein phosphatase C-like n=1 Tax=Thunnus albacares TaxID=8236 RepID=UPI001CF64886|nr:receptor-type tyrosine-protein phosphatase C-like [Thunnus albacares]